MGLDDSVFDACADIVENRDNQKEIKRSLIYEIVYYSVIYLDDDLFSEEHKKWIKKLDKKYGKFHETKEWAEYYDCLVNIAKEVDENMGDHYYDKIWEDYDKLPLNDLDELINIIENRAFDLMQSEIWGYLKENYDYFKNGFKYLKSKK